MSTRLKFSHVYFVIVKLCDVLSKNIYLYVRIGKYEPLLKKAYACAFTTHYVELIVAIHLI